MSITFDPPREVRTVRRNGLPIGNVFTNKDGFYFNPLSRPGQDLKDCHSETLKELEDDLEMQVKKASDTISGVTI